MASQLTWVKTGDRHTASEGGFEIVRVKVCGRWGAYLYRHGQFVIGFKDIEVAKEYAAEMMTGGL